jgi:hypothetical protein
MRMCTKVTLNGKKKLSVGNQILTFDRVDFERYEMLWRGVG